MEYGAEAKGFIQKNIELIDTENWKEFLNRVDLDFRMNDSSKNEIRQILASCGIDPIKMQDISRIPNCWYYKDPYLTQITIPDNIQAINQSAFRECLNLKELKFPKGLTSVHYYAFLGCTSLERIDLKDSAIINLGSAIFQDCTALKEAILPRVMQHIGTCTFKNCTSLDNVILPKSLTVIDKEVFTNCTSLSNIFFMGTIEEWKAVHRYDRCFVGVPTKIIICTDGITNLRPKAQWQG
jgi:hypothetical protein